MSSEQLRILWTVVGGIGSVAGLVAAVIGWWLMRDSARTNWAIQQVQTSVFSLHRMHSQGDVVDSRVLELAIGLMFLTVSAQCGAGLAAEFGSSSWALVLLVVSEILTVSSLVVMVVLGVLKLNRRRRIFTAVRNKEAD